MEVLEAAAKRTKAFFVIKTKNREAYYKGHGECTVTFILFKKKDRGKPYLSRHIVTWQNAQETT